MMCVDLVFKVEELIGGVVIVKEFCVCFVVNSVVV